MIDLERSRKLYIEEGYFKAYFVFAVSDTIELDKLQTSTESFRRAQFSVHSSQQLYIHFVTPPLFLAGPELEISGISVKSSYKIYSSGTISIRFSFPMTGEWAKCVEFTAGLRQDNQLELLARQHLEKILSDVNFALTNPRTALMEDYYLIHVVPSADHFSASELLEIHPDWLARMIVGDDQKISKQEQKDILKTYFSYYANDFTIVHWDSAFIFDTISGASPIEDLLEFTNTQMVELRTLDELLDTELDYIYHQPHKRKWLSWLHSGRGATQRAERLRQMLVDVRELADQSTNALKITGDAFYSRLYKGACQRFGLPDWQKQVESKFDSVLLIYRFIIDEAHHARSGFLEIIIIVLIAIEIFLALIEMFKGH